MLLPILPLVPSRNNIPLGVQPVDTLLAFGQLQHNAVQVVSDHLQLCLQGLPVHLQNQLLPPTLHCITFKCCLIGQDMHLQDAAPGRKLQTKGQDLQLMQ